MRQQLKGYTDNLEHIAEEKTRQLLEVENLAAVGRAASELAHTIKNIAGALKGGIYVMQRGIEDDNRSYLMRGWGMVEGNVDKIKNLAMDLLDFGKSDRLNFQSDTPLRAVNEALELLRNRAEENGIVIKVDTSPALVPDFNRFGKPVSLSGQPDSERHRSVRRRIRPPGRSRNRGGSLPAPGWRRDIQGLR
jgi:signal transduction histidine kinase